MHTHIGKATKYVASIAGGVIRWTLFIPIVLGIAAVPIFPELPPGDAAPLIAFLSGTLLNFVQAEGVALRVMRKRTARSQAWTLVSTAGLTFASLF